MTTVIDQGLDLGVEEDSLDGCYKDRSSCITGDIQGEVTLGCLAESFACLSENSICLYVLKDFSCPEQPWQSDVSGVAPGVAGVGAALVPGGVARAGREAPVHPGPGGPWLIPGGAWPIQVLYSEPTHSTGDQRLRVGQKWLTVKRISDLFCFYFIVVLICEINIFKHIIAFLFCCYFNGSCSKLIRCNQVSISV